MIAGWLRLYRSLLEHPLMTSLPAAWFRIWVWVLLRANWKEGTWWNGHQEVTIPPGSLVTSLEKISKGTATSKQQARGALEYFQAARMATCETTNRYTVITVCNWETYQGSSDQDNTPHNTPDTTETTRRQHAGDLSGNTNRRSNHQEGNQGIRSTDLDCPPTNRKRRDSQAGDGACAKYPKLTEALTNYMNLPGEEFVPPTDRHVAEVVAACWGRTEDEIVDALKYLHDVRDLRYGTKNGPRSYAWFPPVLQDHFNRRDARDEAANPVGYSDWESRNDAKAARMSADEVSEMASNFDVASDFDQQIKATAKAKTFGRPAA